MLGIYREFIDILAVSTHSFLACFPLIQRAIVFL